MHDKSWHRFKKNKLFSRHVCLKSNKKDAIPAVNSMRLRSSEVANDQSLRDGLKRLTREKTGWRWKITHRNDPSAAAALSVLFDISPTINGFNFVSRTIAHTLWLKSRGKYQSASRTPYPPLCPSTTVINPRMISLLVFENHLLRSYNTNEANTSHKVQTFMCTQIKYKL